MGAGAHDDAIYKINKATAETELDGNTGFSSTHALAFDASGKLLALTGFPPPFISAKLLQIDPETGVGTSLGSTRFRSVYGIAVSGTVITGIRRQVESSQPIDKAVAVQSNLYSFRIIPILSTLRRPSAFSYLKRKKSSWKSLTSSATGSGR